MGAYGTLVSLSLGTLTTIERVDLSSCSGWWCSDLSQVKSLDEDGNRCMLFPFLSEDSHISESKLTSRYNTSHNRLHCKSLSTISCIIQTTAIQTNVRANDFWIPDSAVTTATELLETPLADRMCESFRCPQSLVSAESLFLHLAVFDCRAGTWSCGMVDWCSTG